MLTLENNRSPERGRGTLFVVGMWRSGTSLFYALLNQHSQIKLMYEDELPLLWPLFLGRHAKRDWRERWEFWNQALSRHRVRVEDLPVEVSGLREACEATWELYAPEARVRGCKSPNFFDCLPRIADEFPDAKFIVMWRDPADVCRSVVRAQGDSFFAKQGMVLRALLGCRDLKYGYDALVARGAQVYSVQYEELVADPVAVMQGVCNFLEVPFERRMASLRGADRSAIYDGRHHQMVNGEKIVAATKKTEILPEDVRQKVAKYTAFWKKESGGAWPHYSDSGDTTTGLLFTIQRLAERALYRGLRVFDQMVAVLYCYLPIRILRRYRASKGRGKNETLPQTEMPDKELVGAHQK